MLCPEVWNFPPPKVITINKNYENLESTLSHIEMNNFYKSLVVICPDELQTPSSVEEVLLEDSDYYKIINCSLLEFLEPVFIDNFVKKGKLYCLSADRNCIIQNCAAITPNGILTLHLLEFIFQTLGLEGMKRPHNFYEVRIDLTNLKHVNKLKYALDKLEQFDFYVTWEPGSEEICPSSIAKYFNDKGMSVSLCTLEVSRVMPSITEIPSLRDVEPEEMVEWIGLLAHDADLSPTENYISTYCAPDSEYALKSSRMSILIVKGLVTPSTIASACRKLSEYVAMREIDNYWASVSVQSCEDSLWRWTNSSPLMFQSHNSSCSIFFTHTKQILYSIGQLKYS